MSFNLDKNDGAKAPSKKIGFDLSKNDPKAAAVDTDSGNNTATPKFNRRTSLSRTWLYAVLTLILIGVAAWYFMRSSNTIPDQTQITAEETQPKADNSAQGIVVKNDRKADSVARQTAKDSNITHQIEVSPPISGENDSIARPRAGAKQTGQTGKPQLPHQQINGSQTIDIEPINEGNLIAASFRAGSSNPEKISDRIGALIRKRLSENPNLSVNVLGYASSDGSLTINQQISQARADAYKKLLIKKGIAEANIIALGKGIENPVASNDTESGRRKNRRVEVSW